MKEDNGPCGSPTQAASSNTCAAHQTPGVLPLVVLLDYGFVAHSGQGLLESGHRFLAALVSPGPGTPIGGPGGPG